MSLWTIASGTHVCKMWITRFNVFLVVVQLTCLQNVDVWGCLENVQQDAT
jgi:hypothetical protein